MQLKRDAFPAFEEAGVKLLVVGIGSVESGREFAESLDFPGRSRASHANLADI